MASFDDHPNKLALDEFTEVAAVYVAEHSKRRVHVSIQLGAYVFAVECHE